jgi:DNA-binding transcriptional ArsR family regulator
MPRRPAVGEPVHARTNPAATGTAGGAMGDTRVARALAHPLRQRIVLFLLEHDDASAVQLSREWKVELGVVNYHLKRLAMLQLVRLCAEIPRRGSIEHRYTFASSALSAHPLLADLVRRGRRRRATTGDVGAALRRLREQRGMKPVQLARAASVEVEELLAIEQGDANPRLRTLLDLTDSLDGSLFDLLDRGP